MEDAPSSVLSDYILKSFAPAQTHATVRLEVRSKSQSGLAHFFHLYSLATLPVDLISLTNALCHFKHRAFLSAVSTITLRAPI